MIPAVGTLVPYRKSGRRSWLVLGGLAAMFAGLTQLYGLVPFLVVGGVLWLGNASKRRLDWSLATTLLALLAGTLALLTVWGTVIPHASTPNHRDWFVLSWAMAPFYWSAWPFAFATSTPILALVIKRCGRKIFEDPLVAGCWVAVAVLATSTFIYQWGDFRLTMPVSAMLSLTLVVTIGDGAGLGSRRVSRTAFGSAALLSIAFAGLITPTSPAATTPTSSYWVPKVAELRVDPTRTFVGQLLTAKPTDRLGIAAACGNVKDICPSWRMPTGLTVYQRNILARFEELARVEDSAR